MIDLEACLQSIANVIQPISLANNFEFQSYPDSQEQRGKPWVKDIVLLSFTGVEFGSPSEPQQLAIGCQPIHQIVTVKYEVILHKRALRNQNNIPWTNIQNIIDGVSGVHPDANGGGCYVTELAHEIQKDNDQRFYLWKVDFQFSRMLKFSDCDC